MKHFFIPTIGVLALATFSTIAAPPQLPNDPTKLPPVSTQAGVTFDKDIHPMFADACVRCHGEQRPKAGLRLDSLDAVLKGSKDNKEVVPGQSDKSRLVFAVATIDGKTYMPPKPRQRPNPPANGAMNAPVQPAPPQHPWKPLTTEQVGLIRAWIDQGAK